MTRGFFVTGTDTGVGKTVVSCAIVRSFRARGMDVGVLKPVETGVPPAGPLDAQALRAAAGAPDSLEEVCPQSFLMPAAPTVAAAAEGRRVEADAIRAAWKLLSERHQWMVVEGAGGLLVPVWSGATMADLAAEFGLPLVLVVRGALGTINHTRLSLEAAAARGLRVAGVVICHVGGALSAADEANLASLREELGSLLIGEIPPLAEGQLPSPDALDLTALL